MPGYCRDILADLFARFGRIPIVPKEVRVASPPASWPAAPPVWVAGGLVFDPQGRVVLVQHRRDGDGAWWTPGGFLEPGEPADEGFRREVREETGVAATDLQATRLFNVALVDPSGARHPFYFVQFVARAPSSELRPEVPREIEAAQWFDELPASLAFREDYVDDFRTWRPRFRASSPGPESRRPM